MNNCLDYYKSSIGKKQIVATTGLLLILFIVGHLVGNLLVLLGPDAYNGYAKKLASLRPGLYLIEFGLFLVFLIHIITTAILVLENIQSRPIRYQISKSKEERSVAAQLMPYTGTILFVFVIWHLLDFTFVDHEGPLSIVRGKSCGLYGVVYNAFADPAHSYFYIVAMMALGFHLAHGVQSFAQTSGFNDPRYTPLIEKISNGFGLLITLAYSSIPIYVLFNYLSY